MGFWDTDQWHQVDHMQKKPPRSTPTPHHSFLQARCSSWRPTNSVKALKAPVGENSEHYINAIKWLQATATHACQNCKVMQSTLNIDQSNILSEVVCTKQCLGNLLRCHTARVLWTFTKNAEAPRKQLVVLCRHIAVSYNINWVTELPIQQHNSSVCDHEG